MNSLTKFSVLVESSISDVIAKMNEGAKKVVCVLDGKGAMVGLISDGDLRRGILSGLTLSDRATQIMNENFKCVYQGVAGHEIEAVLKNSKLPYIPELNPDGVLLSLHFASEKSVHNRDNTVLIMAGGRGERLRPLTSNCPKPMLEIDGKPMLEIILNQFIDSGFSKFIFSVNYLKEQIIEYFGNGDGWSVDIDYLFEDRPLGTAGALGQVDEAISRNGLIVINGDVLTDLDLNGLIIEHERRLSDFTVCVRPYPVTLPYGVVEISNGIEITGIMEKPEWLIQVNAGVYVLNGSILRLVAPGEYLDMPDLITKAIEAGHKIYAHSMHERWFDVGTPGTLKSARESRARASSG